MPQGDGPISEESHAVDLLRRGDVRGLETLVRRYQLQATRAAYLVVRDRQLAEDIVGDAFLRCYERIQQFDTDRPFAPWFLRMVVNDALKAAERRARHVSLSSSIGGLSFADLLPDQVAGPDLEAERAELRREVEVALQSLTPRQHAAIVLYYFVGLSGRRTAWRDEPEDTRWHFSDAPLVRNEVSIETGGIPAHMSIVVADASGTVTGGIPAHMSIVVTDASGTVLAPGHPRAIVWLRFAAWDS